MVTTTIVTSSPSTATLTQTAGPCVLPDPTGDFTLLLWCQSFAPPLIMPAYRCPLVLWTVDGSLADPFAEIQIAQVDGAQAVRLNIHSAGTSTALALPSGPICVAVTYGGTSHVWTLKLFHNNTWIPVGTKTQDFSGTPFATMYALNDGASAGNMGVGYFRLWNGSILTDDALSLEAASAVAIQTTDLVTDTPLVSSDDLDDLTSNHNNWTAVGSVFTQLPGPLGGDPAIYVIGEEGLTQIAATQGAVTNLLAAPTYSIVAACAARPTVANGTTHWLACDNSVTSGTQLIHRKTDGTVLATVECATRLCVGTGANKCLMELPDGHLLTCVRATGAVVKVSTADGSILQTYSLTITPLDAVINAAGTRLVYVDGLDINVWDLTDDLLAATLFTMTDPAGWPVWLADSSLILSRATYLADGPLVRYDLQGNLLQAYSYDGSSTFEEGQYGFAASLHDDVVLLAGDWDKGTTSEQPGLLRFTLSTGATLGRVVPLVSEATDIDIASAVFGPWVSVDIDPVPPAPVTNLFAIRRLKRFRIPFASNKWIFLSRLEVFLQSGMGTVDVPDPIVMLRLSRDGGQTWGSERQGSAGAMGDFGRRVYWNALGRGRDFVCELTVSDAVPWYFLEAIADITEGTS